MRMIFICSKFGGSAKLRNRAKALCRIMALFTDTIPIAPHVYFPEFLLESSEEERELGIRMGCRLSELCDDFFIVREKRDKNLSSGMMKEISHYIERTGRAPTTLTFEEFEEYCQGYIE